MSQEEGSQPPPVPDETESTSAKVRQEIKDVILPRLQNEGKDPSSKDVYPKLVKELGTKYGIHYGTVKKSWDKVLRDAGALPPSPPPPTRSTTGQITTEIKGQPKPLPPPPETPPGDEQPPPGEKEPPIKLPKETAAKLFASMHKGTAETLYRLAEAAWGVPVQRPDQNKDGTFMSIDDGGNPYYQAGSLWAEVIDAYNIEVNKLLALAMATVNTGQLLAMPIFIARGELKRKQEEEKKKKEEESKK